ncbi:MAG TPA: phosphatase PAP2 family protein [Nocardioidaceae bacterium]|nr:phosphatase PAP2 family protein [Nocardioidaceae bacterium]
MTAFFPLSRGEGRWLVGCVLALAILSADVVSGGPLTAFDTILRDRVQGDPASAPLWLQLPSDLGGIGVGSAVILVVALVTGQKIWRFWPVIFAVATLAVLELLVYVSKSLIARPGPGERTDLSSYPGYFPSGHAATSAVATGVVIFLAFVWTSTRRLDTASLAGQVGAVVMGFLAVLRALVEDFHWLTDGIAGVLLASIVLTLSFAAARRYVQVTGRRSPLPYP